MTVARTAGVHIIDADDHATKSQLRRLRIAFQPTVIFGWAIRMLTGIPLI